MNPAPGNACYKTSLSREDCCRDLRDSEKQASRLKGLECCFNNQKALTDIQRMICSTRSPDASDATALPSCSFVSLWQSVSLSSQVLSPYPNGATLKKSLTVIDLKQQTGLMSAGEFTAPILRDALTVGNSCSAYLAQCLNHNQPSLNTKSTSLADSLSGGLALVFIGNRCIHDSILQTWRRNQVWQASFPGTEHRLSGRWNSSNSHDGRCTLWKPCCGCATASPLVNCHMHLSMLELYYLWLGYHMDYLGQ